MRFLWTTIRQQRWTLMGALALATINQFFSLLDPQIFRLLIDRYATHAHELSRGDFTQGVILLLFAYVGVALVSRIAKNFQDYTVNVVTQRAGAQLYERSVEHTFALPYHIFEDQRSGEILQKLQKARLDSQQLITSFVNVVFLSFVGILFVLVYAFFVHWAVGVVYALLIPFLAASTWYISRRIKVAQRRVVLESASLAGTTTETLRNVELVKSLGLEEQETRRLNHANEHILDLELKKVKIVRTLSFIQGTLINAMRAALMFLMLWLIFTNAMTLGEFFSLFVYSFFIFGPLTELGTVASQYQEARASIEALEHILSLPKEEKPNAPLSVQHFHSVRFVDVSFYYAEGNDPALHRVNVDIPPGGTVAFVGPSGSGKTTLVKLLLGLYLPTGGSILLNDIDVQTLDYDAIRNRIGYVAQETQLFAGTIRENLLFVRPDASDTDCLDALRRAAVLPLLDRGKKGLETRIGEGGIKISGGERQRLAIARALLRHPDLIIFDEATSDLDSITERAITETIQSISQEQNGLMTVMVAHRLSTIAHADHIYVLAKGKIVESGKHAALLKKHGLYAALWQEQSARR